MSQIICENLNLLHPLLLSEEQPIRATLTSLIYEPTPVHLPFSRWRPQLAERDILFGSVLNEQVSSVWPLHWRSDSRWVAPSRRAEHPHSADMTVNLHTHLKLLPSRHADPHRLSFVCTKRQSKVTYCRFVLLFLFDLTFSFFFLRWRTNSQSHVWSGE